MPAGSCRSVLRVCICASGIDTGVYCHVNSWYGYPWIYFEENELLQACTCIEHDTTEQQQWIVSIVQALDSK